MSCLEGLKEQFIISEKEMGFLFRARAIASFKDALEKQKDYFAYERFLAGKESE